MAGEAARARGWLWLTVAFTLGAMLAAALFAPPAGSAPGRGLAWLLFIGSSVHVASTAWFYTVPEIRDHARRHRARYLWVPLALIAGAGAIASAVSLSVLRWCLLPYFGWQFFHYQKQNVGMTALAAAAERVPGLRPGERRALIAAGLAGIAGLLSRPWLLQVTARPATRWLYPVAAIAFGGAVLAGLAALSRRPGAQRPAGYCVTYSVSLAFSLPVFLFTSPYAAVAGMTIAHGLQYLLIVGLVAAGGADGQHGPDQHGPGRLMLLAMPASIALAGGALLAAASHLHGPAPVPRFAYGAYFGAVMAHFVIDARLWRLRDEFPRAFLAARVPYLIPLSGGDAAVRGETGDQTDQESRSADPGPRLA